MTKVRAAIMKRAVAVIVSCSEWLTQRCAFTNSLYLSKKPAIYLEESFSFHEFTNFKFRIPNIFDSSLHFFSVKMCQGRQIRDFGLEIRN